MTENESVAERLEDIEPYDEILLEDYDALQIAIQALREKQERESYCGCKCGEPDPSFCATCKRIRVRAIKEKLERDNPQPLTLAQLKERNGKYVCVGWLDGDGKHSDGFQWCKVSNYKKSAESPEEIFKFKDYGKTWLAYDHEPKESEE